MNSAERCNWLGSQLGARHYLEIGVNEGKTFRDITIPYKTGVDPNFLFDIQQVLNLSLIHI